MSNISVVFDGRSQTLEEALDACMRDSRAAQQPAHGDEAPGRPHRAEIDESEDFRESVEFEDSAFDLVSGMIRLLKGSRLATSPAQLWSARNGM